MDIESSEKAKRVYDLLRQVPRGRITTYGALAKAAGIPKAPRLVGAIMRSNPYAPEVRVPAAPALNHCAARRKVPCHRVVKSDGSIGGFSGSDPKNIAKKIRMLKQEGVSVKEGKVKDFGKVFFDRFR